SPATEEWTIRPARPVAGARSLSGVGDVPPPAEAAGVPLSLGRDQQAEAASATTRTRAAVPTRCMAPSVPELPSTSVAVLRSSSYRRSCGEVPPLTSWDGSTAAARQFGSASPTGSRQGRGLPPAARTCRCRSLKRGSRPDQRHHLAPGHDARHRTNEDESRLYRGPRAPAFCEVV